MFRKQWHACIKYLCTQGSTVLAWSWVEHRELVDRWVVRKWRCLWHTCSADTDQRRGWRSDHGGALPSGIDRTHRRGSKILMGPRGSIGPCMVFSDSSPLHSDQSREKWKYFITSMQSTGTAEFPPWTTRIWLFVLPTVYVFAWAKMQLKYKVWLFFSIVDQR